MCQWLSIVNETKAIREIEKVQKETYEEEGLLECSVER